MNTSGGGNHVLSIRHGGLLTHEEIPAVIPGARNMVRVMDNVAAGEVQLDDRTRTPDSEEESHGNHD